MSKKTKPAKAGWEKLEGASPDAPDFSAVREHCPPEKPLAIRHSLLAAVLTFASRYSLPFP
ncbi:MAG: hypothetical protein OGMRLDGQ_002076, partial [Candidatus Fervidibacter sp.]